MQYTFCIRHRCSRLREFCGVYFLYTLKFNYIQKVYIKKTGLKFHLVSVYTKYTPNNLFEVSVGLEYTNSIQKVYLCGSWFCKGDACQQIVKIVPSLDLMMSSGRLSSNSSYWKVISRVKALNEIQTSVTWAKRNTMQLKRGEG